MILGRAEEGRRAREDECAQQRDPIASGKNPPLDRKPFHSLTSLRLLSWHLNFEDQVENYHTLFEYGCLNNRLTCWTGNNGAYGIVSMKLGVYENMVAAGTASKFDICGSSILHPTWLGSVLTSIPACFIVVLPFDGRIWHTLSYYLSVGYCGEDMGNLNVHQIQSCYNKRRKVGARHLELQEMRNIPLYMSFGAEKRNANVE
ncbi:hypothetical protein COLO4_08214 [Corchorus olitorius]|uniref:Uncharacterized protein n=1 Tax=Corchorus olitorius TaxID=93759 RepID=A0A1R3KGW8_9ROSI|nr:hypothetical protein COLO4_08214 [Corchorus olitorius]